MRDAVADAFEELMPYRQALAKNLLELRANFANGHFLRKHFYNVDESRLAGNTHHYWLRLGLAPDAILVIESMVCFLPDHLAGWLTSELKRKLLRRMFPQYSTLIKIPFSVEIGKVGEERTKEVNRCIEQRLPAALPYAIFFQEIGRLLRALGVSNPPPSEAEFDVLLGHYSQNAIDKARLQFPEVWDEERGNYVLDSRGSQFAKQLVLDLESQNLLAADSKFIDVGSGSGVNVFFVNQYSDAHATGAELHAGLISISKVIKRRLNRMGQLDSGRLELIHADVFDSGAVNLALFDVVYVYSPLGEAAIDIDQVVDGIKPGAVVIFNRMPSRNRTSVERLKNVAGLYAFRKLSKDSVLSSALNLERK